MSKIKVHRGYMVNCLVHPNEKAVVWFGNIRCAACRTRQILAGFCEFCDKNHHQPQSMSCPKGCFGYFDLEICASRVSHRKPKTVCLVNPGGDGI